MPLLPDATTVNGNRKFALLILLLHQLDPRGKIKSTIKMIKTQINDFLIWVMPLLFSEQQQQQNQPLNFLTTQYLEATLSNPLFFR